MAVSAADIAPKAFEQLVKQGGDHQDVEDDLQVHPWFSFIFQASLASSLPVVVGSVGCGWVRLLSVWIHRGNFLCSRNHTFQTH